MSDITTAFVKKFEANIQLTVQQLESYFQDKVTIKQISPGAKLYMDYIGEFTPQLVTGRNSDTPCLIPDHSRRRINARTFVSATLIDPPDAERMLSDPASQYMIGFRAGFKRKIDIDIAAAAIGDSYSVVGEDLTETAIPLPATQIVAETGTVGMTMQKVRQALLIFNRNDVPVDEPKWLALSAQAIYDLQGEVELTEAEQGALKIITTGKVAEVFGFKVVMSNRLAISAGLIRSNFAWVRSGLGLGMIYDIKTKLTTRDDKNHAVQPWMSMDFGATRLQEKLVVELRSYESATP